MIPIVSIVGRSDSGKTTLIERLVPELTRRGYKVGTVKHDVHGFDIDHPGKDSYRHFQSGSSATVISSPSKVAVVRKVATELRLDEVVHNYLLDVDIVLTEGFKQENKRKIELVRPDEDNIVTPLSAPEDLVAIAVVGGEQVPLPPAYADIPVFSADDITGLADSICENVLTLGSKSGVHLMVDGISIPLNPIMEAMVGSSVKGLISTLKGCANPRKIVLRIDRK